MQIFVFKVVQCSDKKVMKNVSMIVLVCPGVPIGTEPVICGIY